MTCGLKCGTRKEGPDEVGNHVIYLFYQYNCDFVNFFLFIFLPPRRTSQLHNRIQTTTKSWILTQNNIKVITSLITSNS